MKTNSILLAVLSIVIYCNVYGQTNETLHDVIYRDIFRSTVWGTATNNIEFGVRVCAIGPANVDDLQIVSYIYNVSTTNYFSYVRFDSRTPDIEGCINVRFLPEAVSWNPWSLSLTRGLSGFPLSGTHVLNHIIDIMPQLDTPVSKKRTGLGPHPAQVKSSKTPEKHGLQWRYVRSSGLIIFRMPTLLPRWTHNLILGCCPAAAGDSSVHQPSRHTHGGQRCHGGN